MIRTVFFVILLFCMPSVFAQALDEASAHLDMAESFNKSCTGAIKSTTRATYGEANLPEPLKLEPLLKQSIYETLGLDESSRLPGFSRLQIDLGLLNVSKSHNCADVQQALENEFYIYGLKAWVERAGAASYILIRRSKEEPQMIELRSSFTW